ncbi:MAG: mono/diheme cytochrome c family protein [Hyphomicrobiaceae bacterium]|jgi:S-disulfanyl-L-cysteine oxidoreductase SoxD
MSKSLKAICAVAATTLLLGISAANAGKYNLGRKALPEEIKAWNTDVRPDGQGLPKGQGKVSDGETIYNEQCAACHGDFGEGKDRWPVLVGGKDTLKSDDPVKTIGSYWPYTSTIFDYVRRSMPFGNAQSLSANETYALTAYLLYMNEIIDDEKFVLSDKNFTSVRLPNEKNFTKDVRPDTPTQAQQKPCMKNCKTEVKITGRARVLDVTPDAKKE